MRTADGLHRLERYGGHITRRQTQMLELAADGLTDKQIAARLGLALPTIRSYWQRLYKENRVHGRAAAMAFWLRGRGNNGVTTLHERTSETSRDGTS